jgi:cytochrome o ubiquinol oxidase operon protein cyoD
MSQPSIDDGVSAGGNLKTYTSGFVLSLILTVISFALVVSGTLPHSVILFGLSAAAVVQMVTHLHYFLNLDACSSVRWNVLALAFTVLIMFIFVGGSIWIMFNLNYRMM